jgi:hypothetical protein
MIDHLVELVENKAAEMAEANTQDDASEGQ